MRKKSNVSEMRLAKGILQSTLMKSFYYKSLVTDKAMIERGTKNGK